MNLMFINCRMSDSDVSLSELKVRMSHPVTPGQTLKIEMWNRYFNHSKWNCLLHQTFSASENLKSCERIVLFRTKIEETGDICLTGGWIKLLENN